MIKDTSKFNQYFLKNYNEESDERYFLKFIFNILNLHEFHIDLSFLRESMKIEKIKKVVANLHDKTEYFVHTRIRNNH